MLILNKNKNQAYVLNSTTRFIVFKKIGLDRLIELIGPKIDRVI